MRLVSHMNQVTFDRCPSGAGSTSEGRAPHPRARLFTPVRTLDGRYRTAAVLTMLVFILCQVIGIMCVVPDFSMAEESISSVDEGLNTVCPMDKTTDCDPSMTSSAEREVRYGAIVLSNQEPNSFAFGDMHILVCIPQQSTLNSDSSITPIPTAPPLVLRI